MAERERLIGMSQRLLRFTTILAVPALGLGLWLWLGYGFAGGWLHAKLLLVLAVMGYHYSCAVLLRQLQADSLPAQPPLVSLVQRTAGAAAHGHCDLGGCQAFLNFPPRGPKRKGAACVQRLRRGRWPCCTPH